MKCLLTALLLCTLASLTEVQAGWLQYETATRQIIGAFNTQADAIPAAGTAIIEWMPGTPAANLPWPAPSTCATGRKEWTLMSPGPALPPILNPALIFFRCIPVTNRKTLFAAGHAAIKQAAAEYIDGVGEFTATILHEMLMVCPVGDNTTNCPEIRTAAATIRANMIRGKGQLRTLADAAAAIATEVEAIRIANGF